VKQGGTCQAMGEGSRFRARYGGQDRLGLEQPFGDGDG
jgi:hypothetical protein